MISQKSGATGNKKQKNANYRLHIYIFLTNYNVSNKWGDLMKKKTTIRELYFFAWFCNVIFMVIGIVIGVQIITGYTDVIDNPYDIAGIVGLICITVGCGVALICSAVGIFTLLKDIRSVKNKNYISIIGTVLNFEKNVEPESGAQINDTPTVLVLDTNEKVTLKINDEVAVGETYRFNYLKNSKIAEVVGKI